MNSASLKYLVIHLRFATPLYMTPLTELFSYEIRGLSTAPSVNVGRAAESATIGIFALWARSNRSQDLTNYNTWFTSHFRNYMSPSKLYYLRFAALIQNLYVLAPKELVALMGCTFKLTKASITQAPTQGFISYQFHQLHSLERIFIFTPLKLKMSSDPKSALTVTTSTLQ